MEHWAMPAGIARIRTKKRLAKQTLAKQTLANRLVVLIQRVWRKRFYAMGGKAGDVPPIAYSHVRHPEFSLAGSNFGILNKLVPNYPSRPSPHGPRDLSLGYRAPWPKQRPWFTDQYSSTTDIDDLRFD